MEKNMKNLFALTSIFALVACSMSSGGVGGSGRASKSIYSLQSMSQEAMDSNEHITNMSPEILVSAGGANVITRTSNVTHEGKSYTSYRLNDVKFLTAKNFNETDQDNKSFLRLDLDKTGKIVSIHMETDNLKNDFITPRIAGNSELFEGPVFEYVKDGKALYRVIDKGQTWKDLENYVSNNGLSDGHWNRVDERLVFEVSGGDIDNNTETKTKLSYSDFGSFKKPVYKEKHENIDETVLGYIREYETAIKNGDTAKAEDIKDEFLSRDELDIYRSGEEFGDALLKEYYQLFAGGYAIRTDGQRVNTLEPQNNTSFTGKAIGRVYSNIITTDNETRGTYLDKYGIEYDSSKPEEAGHNISKDYSTTNATLVVGDTGDQKLVMPFDGFYKVTVEKLGDDAATITFDSGTAQTGNMYRRDADVTTGPVGTPGDPVSSFNPGYYGINNPSEAAGTIQYKEVTDFGGGNTREWEFQAAYGMKPDTTTNP